MLKLKNKDTKAISADDLQATSAVNSFMIEVSII